MDIGRLVNAELDRCYPNRAKMRPTDPAGFREAWDVVERPVAVRDWVRRRRAMYQDAIASH